METYFSPTISRNILKIGALFNLVWGLLCLFSPNSFIPLANASAFIVFVGLIYCFLSLGLIIASLDKARYWPVILICGLTALSASAVFLYFTVSGFYDFGTGGALFIFHFALFFPFVGVLNASYIENTYEESAPKRFHDLVNVVKTSQNKTLLDLSNERNVLLVFIRHFGCTFCRETVSEIAKIDEAILGKNFTLVYVHMSDKAHGDEFFSKYYQGSVHHISDPAKKLYHSLNLKRGTLMQLFGPATWLRGIYAGLVKGHGIGEVEGDSLQLGGVFVLSRGQIVFEERSKCASHLFNLNTLPEL